MANRPVLDPDLAKGYTIKRIAAEVESDIRDPSDDDVWVMRLTLLEVTNAPHLSPKLLIEQGWKKTWTIRERVFVGALEELRTLMRFVQLNDVTSVFAELEMVCDS
jgi:hypothetical protein